jgi:hypothetical protein
MRAYGALLWSLGRVMNIPDVMWVYIGSFNDKSINDVAIGPIGKDLFEKEQEDLLSDLKSYLIVDICKGGCLIIQAFGLFFEKLAAKIIKLLVGVLQHCHW